jgi:hypothetical protein
VIWFLLIGAAIWAGCGVVTYGVEFAFYQRNWPCLARLHERADQRFAVVAATFGPFGLFDAYLGKHFVYGVKWRRQDAAPCTS